MEEVRYWQYKWKTDRLAAYKEGFHRQLEGTDLSFKNSLMDGHDELVGSKKVELSEIDKEHQKKDTKAVSESKKEPPKDDKKV